MGNSSKDMQSLNQFGPNNQPNRLQIFHLWACNLAQISKTVNEDTLIFPYTHEILQAIPREAREFRLGEVKYYMVLIFDAIFWQLTNMGLFGLLSCSSSLFSGILIAVLLPVCEILAVIFLHEKFDGSKGVALALCLWGFTSYLYGERKLSKRLKKMTNEVEIPLSTP